VREDHRVSFGASRRTSAAQSSNDIVGWVSGIDPDHFQGKIRAGAEWCEPADRQHAGARIDERAQVVEITPPEISSRSASPTLAIASPHQVRRRVVEQDPLGVRGERVVELVEVSTSTRSAAVGARAADGRGTPARDPDVRVLEQYRVGQGARCRVPPPAATAARSTARSRAASCAVHRIAAGAAAST
jgi:hypothetical protein